MGQTLKYAALALVTFLAVAAIADTIINYQYPQDGIIEGASLAMYVNGVLKANGTAMDWGVCPKGTVQTFSNVTVANTGNVNLTVTIVATGLPSGWILEWQANNTFLEPYYAVEGWLNLTIPTTATTWPTWSFSLNGSA
jgi:hypothetical protein